MDPLSQPFRPDPRRDPQLGVTLICTVATGIILWRWLPHGYSAHIAANLWQVLNIILLYPVVEELLFRGVIQSELLRRKALAIRDFGISRANMLSSLLFAGLHLINHAPLWAFSVLIPSLVLGHFRERYGNLIAPIVLHVLFNAVWLIGGIG